MTRSDTHVGSGAGKAQAEVDALAGMALLARRIRSRRAWQGWSHVSPRCWWAGRGFRRLCLGGGRRRQGDPNSIVGEPEGAVAAVYLEAGGRVELADVGDEQRGGGCEVYRLACGVGSGNVEGERGGDGKRRQ
ncbi:MAG: hypothetical protein ACUVUA_10230 [Chloroflexus sp.]|uniref:hypothetical protein n=1 Tax=Chloroflexus sp. TaxID=1904827 RepID=UPI0040491F0A